MSYEGRVQRWCKGGHYMEYDCYALGHHIKCPICAAEWALENNVDDTNGESHGFIKPKIIKVIKCDHCGTALETKYQIPKKRKKT